MLDKIKQVRVPLPIVYGLIVIATVLSCSPARSLMIVQSVWIMVVLTTYTVNFALFLFMWGMLSDKLTKRYSKRKGWLIFAIGLVVILLAFRFLGGMKTIFG